MFGEKKLYFAGIVAAIATVTIWATFLIGTRFAVSRNLTVDEVLILRLVPAFIIMTPLMLKVGIFLKGQSIIGTLMIALGASAVFPYLISSGVYYAPASDAGALAPGMLPFWTALFAFIIVGERPTKLRSLGLIIILVGAFLVGSYGILRASDAETWKGHFLFLAGSGMWSMYSVYFKKSGINPLIGLVFGLFWGSVIAVPTLIIFGDVNFAKASNFDIISMIFLQGILIAIVAMLLYNFALQQLGAPQTAAFGALTPVLALIGGVVFLNENITSSTFFGIILVSIGVIFASGVLENKKY